MIEDAWVNKIASLWKMNEQTPLKPHKFYAVEASDRAPITLPECEPTEEARQARDLGNVLLSGHSINFSALMKLAPATLIGMSGPLSFALHNEIKTRLLALTESLLIQQEQGEFTADTQVAAECLLNNIINYGAQFGYELGDTLMLPVFEDGKVKGTLYQVEKIPLTGDRITSTYPCYIFNPVSDRAAPPQLVFKSTTYPGSEGFLWALVADLTPGYPIGTPLFYMGKDKIKAWLDKQTVPAILHGHSLGGTMAIFTADAYKDKIQRAFAYGPAGGYTSDLDGEKVTIMYGGSDPVGMLGDMPKGARYVYALPNDTLTDRPTESHYTTRGGFIGGFASHAMGVASQPNAQLFTVEDDHMLTGHPNKAFMNKAHTVAKFFGFPVMVSAQAITAGFRAVYKVGAAVADFVAPSPLETRDPISAYVHPVLEQERFEHNPNAQFVPGLRHTAHRKKNSEPKNQQRPQRNHRSKSANASAL